MQWQVPSAQVMCHGFESGISKIGKKAIYQTLYTEENDATYKPSSILP